jgi:hypothetical protein
MPYILPDTVAACVAADRRRHPAIYREMPSSAQAGQDRVDELYLKELLETARNSEFTRRAQRFAALADDLAELRNSIIGWDGYDAPTPNENSLAAAENGLRFLKAINAEPTAVMPSADGGVGLCFMRNDRYAHIEFLNNGETWALMYSQMVEPQVWQLATNDDDSVGRTWTRIGAFLQS